MKIVVDGHNLMFAAARLDRRFAVERGEPAREEVLALLSRYQAVKGDKILCFFDGGRAGKHLPRDAFGHGLQIRYSDPDSDADTDIKRHVASSGEPETIRVITSDNAIRAFVQGCGASVTESRAFLEEVRSALTEDTIPADEPIEKYEEPDQDEEDFWMGVFGGDEDLDAD